MTLPTPTPPECIAKALRECVVVASNPDSIALILAQAVWDALTSEGSIWWRDTGDRETNNLVLANRHWNSRCEPVLVVPLARHNPEDAT